VCACIHLHVAHGVSMKCILWNRAKVYPNLLVEEMRIVQLINKNWTKINTNIPKQTTHKARTRKYYHYNKTLITIYKSDWRVRKCLFRSRWQPILLMNELMIVLAKRGEKRIRTLRRKQ
jgi:hypothetical protein